MQPFTISLANYLGVTVNLTQTNLTTQNVFVDTIAPTITLNGDADYTVFVNSTYVEPGVVASDGDPNYVQTYTTINNSLTFNTSIIGSNVTYTYTANYLMAAGNLGETITRNCNGALLIYFDPRCQAGSFGCVNERNMHQYASIYHSGI